MSRRVAVPITAGKTGMTFTFLLTMERADGTGKRMEEVRVIAPDTAGAWAEVGKTVRDFMRSPRSMRVTDVQLWQP